MSAVLITFQRASITAFVHIDTIHLSGSEEKIMLQNKQKKLDLWNTKLSELREDEVRSVELCSLYVRSEISIAVFMSVQVLWDLVLCCAVL